MKGLLVLSVALLSFACQREDKESTNGYKSLAIIPTPTKILEREGMFILDKHVKLSADFSDLRQHELVAYAVEDIKSIIGHKLKVADLYRTDAKAKTISFILDHEQTNVESYDLLVETNGVKITSSGINGLFYGLQTLLQLIEGYSSNELIQIPAVRIQDQPVMSYRGLMVDQVSEDLFYWENNLKQMARFKLNTLLLNFSSFDDFDSLKKSKYISLSKNYHVRLVPFITTSDDIELKNFNKDQVPGYSVVAADEKAVHLLNKLTSPDQVVLSVVSNSETILPSTSTTLLSITIEDLEDQVVLKELLLRSSASSDKHIGGAVLIQSDISSESTTYLGYHSTITWSDTNNKSLDKTMSAIESFTIDL